MTVTTNTKTNKAPKLQFRKGTAFPVVPVRKIPMNGVSVTGRLVSRKGLFHLAFESTLERDALILLDSDPTVDTIVPQPVRIGFKDAQGKPRTYTPDILVSFKPDPLTGEVRKPLLIEVKPRRSMAKHWGQLRPKFKAAVHYAAQQEPEWRFMVITEQEIRVLGYLPNLRFLRWFAKRQPEAKAKVTVMDFLLNKKECTVQKLVETLCPTEAGQGMLLPVVWHLVSTREVWTDLQVPLTSDSILRHALLPDPKFLWGVDGPPLRTRLVSVPPPVPTCIPKPQPLLSLSVGADVMVGDRPCAILRVLGLSEVLVRDNASGLPERVRIEALRPFVPEGPKLRILPDLAAIPEEKWAKAYDRASVIRPLLLGRRTRQRIDQAAAAAGVSRVTIYRWLNQFVDAGEQTTSLLPCKPSGGRHKSRLPVEIERILQETIETSYLNTQRLKPAATYDEVVRRCREAGIEPPHANTVRKRIDWLSEETKLRRRFGKKVADHAFRIIRGSFPTATWPLETIEMDHTQLDLILVDEKSRLPIGRPWITLAMDVYSRMVLGYYVSLDPPGDISTGLCMAHAILPKEKWLERHGIKTEWPCWGIPGTVYTDNGKEFRGGLLQQAGREYGFNIEWRPAGSPKFGAHIERLLGTLLRELHKLPGTTFSSIAERGNYRSTKKAMLSLSELETWLANHIAGIYHNRAHSGIDGDTPLERYRKGILPSKDGPGRGLPDRIGNEAKLRMDFLPNHPRTVQPHGLEIDCIQYFHPILGTLVNVMDPDTPKVKRQFTVRRDPRDISVVHLFEPETGQYLDIPYRNRSHPPVSIWEWRASVGVADPKDTPEANEKRRFDAIEAKREVERRAASKTLKASRSVARQKKHDELDLHGHKARKVASDPLTAPTTKVAANKKSTPVIPLRAKPVLAFDEIE